jgi:hypothetical protein
VEKKVKAAKQKAQASRLCFFVNDLSFSNRQNLATIVITTAWANHMLLFFVTTVLAGGQVWGNQGVV